MNTNITRPKPTATPIPTCITGRAADTVPAFKGRDLSANVDFYSAPLLYSIGIPVDAFTCMFAMSRIAGWTVHVYEQQADNRLIRPLANYTGQHQLPWTPIEARG